MRYRGVVNRFSAILAAIISIGIAQDNLSAATCPCDIYATAGQPCVAAYSTVRLLLSTYTGPLYQVRATANNATTDVYPLSGGTVANSATQDAFLNGGAGTISKLYDQSGKNNHLVKAGQGGSANTNGDKESNATGKSFYIAGHKAYALYMGTGEGYRNAAPTSIPTGTAAQGIYAVEDGSRANVGCCCCYDFGNAETNFQADGTGSMDALYFGVGYWGKGNGAGPWFMGDFEAGVWSGGGGGYSTNTADPSMTMAYAFGILKTNTGPDYCIRVANATSGNITNVYDGAFELPWKLGGAIILGIGGDNSNSSTGTFYEGVVTAGRPSNATDSLILKNVQAAGYGVTAATSPGATKDAATTPLFKVNYNPSNASAVISYTLLDARHVSMNIVDEQGRQIASIVQGVMSAGPHEAVWDAKRVPTGVYICRITIDGRKGATEKIIVQK